MRSLIIIAYLVVASSAASAKPLADHTRMLDTAEQFVLATIQAPAQGTLEVKAGPIDDRLRLPACSGALSASMPSGARRIGNSTVGVRCDGPEGWKLFVPVTISINAPVVVSSRHISRGELISKDDLRIELRELGNSSREHYTEPSALIGMRARSTISLGNVLTPRLVEAQKLIKRGQSVTIESRRPGLSVHAKGTAMADGIAGERVRVKNSSSGRVLDAVVVGPGRVRSN